MVVLLRSSTLSFLDNTSRVHQMLCYANSLFQALQPQKLGAVLENPAYTPSETQHRLFENITSKFISMLML
jgi:hypothetical protein